MPMRTLVATNAFALVCKVGALVRVQVGTLGALLAIAQPPKRVAYLSGRVDADMRKAAVLVGASSLLEMKTRRDVVGRRLV